MTPALRRIVLQPQKLLMMIGMSTASEMHNESQRFTCTDSIELDCHYARVTSSKESNQQTVKI